MHTFVRSLITEWRRLELPAAGETIVVGVSGGADSVSLLLAMHDLTERKKLDVRLVAAHFNHGLRNGESDADENYVRQLTSERGIEFATARGRPEPTGNVEQNARVARYEFLHRTAERLNAYGVMTGHTINDQAETFLMNLIRGSGPEGLCGMRPMRFLDDHAPSPADGCEAESHAADTDGPLLFPIGRVLVRPLLSWARRRDTEGFCHDSGVEYRYDTMNEDTAFKRVRIRKILLPLLEDMNPRIVETLANTAFLMQQTTEAPSGARSAVVADELRLTEISGLGQADLYETIRSWLRHHRGTTRQLQLKHIQAIERLVLSTKSGRTVEIPGGHVSKTKGRLLYNENKVEN